MFVPTMIFIIISFILFSVLFVLAKNHVRLRDIASDMEFAAQSITADIRDSIDPLSADPIDVTDQYKASLEKILDAEFIGERIDISFPEGNPTYQLQIYGASFQSGSDPDMAVTGGNLTVQYAISVTARVNGHTYTTRFPEADEFEELVYPIIISRN